MNETIRDEMTFEEWDQEAYDEAERAWQEWQEREPTKRGKTKQSEDARLARAEQCRNTVRRHYEEKQRRWEAMMRGEEICEKKAEEIQQQREEERMERKRIANETERRMGMVVWFTIILFGAVGFLRAIFR